MPANNVASNDKVGKLNTNSEHDVDYGVKYIQENVIETAFGPLPGETNDRKREHERRRKFKDKLLAENPGKLIIDSSYIGKDGQPDKQYTNTILVTDQITRWQQCIIEKFSGDYAHKSKELSGGNQLNFKYPNGNKFLSCSFYPMKNKVMVQGSHDDLEEWIQVYRELAETIEVVHGNLDDEADGKANSNDLSAVSQDIQKVRVNQDIQKAGDEAESIVGVSQTIISADSVSIDTAHSSSTAETKADVISDSNSVLNDATIVERQSEAAGDESSETIAADESLLFHSFNETVNTDNIDRIDNINSDNDDSLWTDIVTVHATEKENGAVDNAGKKNVSVKYSKRSSRLSSGSRRKSKIRDSHAVSRIHTRLDAIEGILNGLQGGVMKVVESLQDKTDNMKQLTTDICNSAVDKVNTVVREEARKKPAECLGNKDVVKKLDQMRSLIEKQNGRCLLESIKELKEPLMKVQTDLLQNTDAIHTLGERVAHQETTYSQEAAKIIQAISTQSVHPPTSQETTHSKKSASVIHSQLVHPPKLSIPVSDVRSNASGVAKDRRAPSDEKQNMRETSSGVRETVTAQHIDCSRESSNTALQSETRGREPPNIVRNGSQESTARTVLLVGDSTTKLVDKRHLLRQETISKCRAGTIEDAYHKVSLRSTKEMEKIIFCVGLNDIRNGGKINQVVQDMKCLIDEALYRHPRCFIFICSILPVHSSEMAKQKITSTNSQLKDLEKYHERVHYIDTAAAFLNHDEVWALFEEDGVHPNGKGTMVMMNCIRRKIQQLGQKHSFRNFISKPATPNSLSYADCAARSYGPRRPTSHEADREAAAGERVHNRLDQNFVNTPRKGPQRAPQTAVSSTVPLKDPDVPWRQMYGGYPPWTLPYPYNLPPAQVPTPLYPQFVPEMMMANRLYGY